MNIQKVIAKCDVCGKAYEEKPTAAKFTLDNFESFCPTCAHRVQMAALYKCYEIQNEIEKRENKK